MAIMKIDITDYPTWFRFLSPAARRKLIKRLVSSLSLEEGLALLEGTSTITKSNPEEGQPSGDPAVALSEWT